MFEDYSAERIATILAGEDSEWPWYPYNAEGMPPIGTTYRAHAASLYNVADAIKKPPTDELLAGVLPMYLRSLYTASFVLPLRLRGFQYGLRVIPGHVWGSADLGPLTPLQQPRVMVVGKGPAAEEINFGRNFSGLAGTFLEDALTRIGATAVDPGTWYMCNLLRWTNVSAGKQVPNQWLKDCALLLHQELRILQPEYILCIGAEASSMFCNCGVNAATGQVIPYSYPVHRPGAPEQQHTAMVMPLLQPAAVMRNTSQRPMFDKMLTEFVNLLGGIRPKRASNALTIQYIYTSRDLRNYVDWVLQQPGLKRIAIDAEWNGDYPTEDNAYVRMVQLSHDGKHVAVLQLHDTAGTVQFMPGVDAAVSELRRLLDRPDVMLIGHFLNADLPQLAALGCDLRHRLRVPDTPEQMRGGYAGVFDTGYAAHAHDETGELKLEILCSQYLDVHRWDTGIAKWRQVYCAEHNIKEKALEGYGPCPDSTLGPYAACDAAYTWRLADLQMREGGQLDSDPYGLDCWRPFWVTMRAMSSFLEMHMTGIKLDINRVDEATGSYIALRDELIADLRREANWPDFNPASITQCRELLFGTALNGKKDAEGNPVRVRPAGAITLNATPITSTGERKQEWARLVQRGEESKHDPCTDKEVLGILGHNYPLAARLRDARFISKILTSTLRQPVVVGEGDASTLQYTGGIASFLHTDGRVRSTFYPTMETGRASSSRPPLQVFAKRREADYARIAGDKYKWPLRSIVVSDFDQDDPHVWVEVDYSGAELFVAATQSQDVQMVDHCQRGNLHKSDPNYYDIHSSTAVQAFGLSCAPTKAGLESIGRVSIRIAAKNVIFGLLYGRSADAISRQCHEEGHPISPAEAQLIIDAIYARYPGLPAFQQLCRNRVHSPGWIRNAMGRLRRFILPDDRGAIAELERQAMNFPCQSLVADAVSTAMHNFQMWPTRAELGYKIVLQIHDALILSVPVRSLIEVYDRVIPACMVDAVEFQSCDLDGNVLPSSPWYRFGIEREVCTRWGITLSEEECEKFGIDARFTLAA